MTIGQVPTPPPIRLSTPTTPGTEDEQLLRSVPTPAERARVPHHLFDIVDPDVQYDAGRYAREAADAIATIGGGSTVSQDVPAGQLVVARARQTTIAGWQRPLKKQKS